MQLNFSTKAGTLGLLKDTLKSARISPFISFTVAEWELNRQASLYNIESYLIAPPWIVRSSCNREDGSEMSNAGAFLSIKNVNKDRLEVAIEQVINKYNPPHPSDEVLIQSMLVDVTWSGVAFSHDPNTCAPYRVVNWAKGCDTEIVTSGGGGHVWQQAAESPVVAPPQFKPVLALLQELLDLFGDVPVDCEFAFTRELEKEQLWLLQARPLILTQSSETKKEQTNRLEKIHCKVKKGMCPNSSLIGKRTIYGVMPDWNPAEIIGIRPKPLALSIYRDLVTDRIWAYQRNNYGYRNLSGFPLMIDFFGLPYVDVRLSFNSFIPANLEENLARRLVDYYIDRLISKPTLHDKIEFKIVFSCYTFDLTRRLKRLEDFGFSSRDQKTIAESLCQLTNQIIHPSEGLWRSDVAKIEILNIRREKLLSSNLEPIECIYWLLEDIKHYGTLPFAGLARTSFIAVQMLNSLVAMEVFSQSDYDSFIRNISTVSSQLAQDWAKLDKSTFLDCYGHLRPGTYDILSPRYDETPELYFDWKERSVLFEPVKPFSPTLPQKQEIIKLLKANNLDTDPVGLFDFIEAGIKWRELAKFHFTRNLSDALTLMSKVGEKYGIERDDLAYSNVHVFQQPHETVKNMERLLISSIEQGKARYVETQKVSLPPLITTPENVWSFEWPDAEPNFITQKQITAPVLYYEVCASPIGALVCIPNADPGFDWLFAHPIAGLITAWGGPNSHMAIRAGELGLPAVIGAGEVLYRQWSKAQYLHVDCAGRRVKIIK